jgi:hypothetical protein
MQFRRMRGEPRHRASPTGFAGELVLGPDGEIRMGRGQGLQGADGMRLHGAGHLAEDQGGGDECLPMNRGIDHRAFDQEGVRRHQ